MESKLFFFCKGILMLLMISGFFCNQPHKDNRGVPNILLAIADDVSYPHMGIYGTDWVSTPNFDQVSREGLLFDKAYTPNAKCAPSRAIILTGRNSWQLEEAANHWCYFPDKFKTIWEALKEAGYLTGHVAKGWAPGTVSQIKGVNRELVGKAYSNHRLDPPTTGISNVDYAANFDEFLMDRGDDKQPFAFWYGSLEPHRAYEFGSGQRLGGKDLSDITSTFGFFPETDTVRHDLMDYAFEIEHFDMHLGKMISKLEEIGELENTLIIVTADNGMPFPRVKGQAYERSNHLPLAMRWGRGIKNPGRVIHEIVSFTDFAPTILEAAGVAVEKSGMKPFEGQSLMDLFQDRRSEPVRQHMLIGKERHDVGRPGDAGYPIRGIITSDYLLVVNLEPDRWPAGNPETGYLNCDGGATKSSILNLFRARENDFYWNLSFGKRPAEELYKIKEDPDCLYNVADQMAYREIQQLLKTQLMHELEKQQDPRMFGQGEIFDQYEYQHKAHQNFYEKYMLGTLDEHSAGWVNPSDFESKDFTGIKD